MKTMRTLTSFSQLRIVSCVFSNLLDIYIVYHSGSDKDEKHLKTQLQFHLYHMNCAVLMVRFSQMYTDLKFTERREIPIVQTDNKKH